MDGPKRWMAPKVSAWFRLLHGLLRSGSRQGFRGEGVLHSRPSSRTEGRQWLVGLEARPTYLEGLRPGGTCTGTCTTLLVRNSPHKIPFPS